jgi:hypothetical protein
MLITIGISEQGAAAGFLLDDCHPFKLQSYSSVTKRNIDFAARKMAVKTRSQAEADFSKLQVEMKNFVLKRDAVGSSLKGFEINIASIAYFKTFKNELIEDKSIGANYYVSLSKALVDTGIFWEGLYKQTRDLKKSGRLKSDAKKVNKLMGRYLSEAKDCYLLALDLIPDQSLFSPVRKPLFARITEIDEEFKKLD